MKVRLSARLRIGAVVGVTLLASGALFDPVSLLAGNLLNSVQGLDVNCGSLLRSSRYDCGPAWSLTIELRSAALLVVVLAGLCWATWLLAGWALRPVARLAETVRQAPHRGPACPCRERSGAGWQRAGRLRAARGLGARRLPGRRLIGRGHATPGADRCDRAR